MQYKNHRHVLCGIPQFYNIFVLHWNSKFMYMVDGSWTVKVGIWYTHYFLGAFEKLRKATISCNMSPSLRPHGKIRLPLDGFSWNTIFEYFPNICRRKFNFNSNLTRKTGTLHEDQYTFFIVSRSFFFRMKNVSDPNFRKTENTHFTFNNFSLRSCRLWYNVEKNILQWGRPYMTIWRMRIACRMPKATNIHTEYVIRIAFQMQQWLHERASMLRYKNIAWIACYWQIQTNKQTNKQTGDQIYLQTPHCCTFVPPLNFPTSMYRGFCAILGHLSIMLFYIPQSALTLRHTLELAMWERH
jgi:hypothetical protein